MTGMGVEVGAQAARSRALAVLRIRSRALAVALLPAAVAVVLLVGGSTGHITGGSWPVTSWIVTVIAALGAARRRGHRARRRPRAARREPHGPSSRRLSAPDLYRLVRDLADRLDVPPPSAIALTPDCDSWLEDRTHPAHGPPPPEHRDEIAGVRGVGGGVPAEPPRLRSSSSARPSCGGCGSGSCARSSPRSSPVRALRRTPT